MAAGATVTGTEFLSDYLTYYFFATQTIGLLSE